MNNFGSRYKIGAREFTRWPVEQGGRAEVELLVGSLHKFFAILLCTMRPMVCSVARDGNAVGTRLDCDRPSAMFSANAIVISGSVATIQWDDGRQATSIARVELKASQGA